MKKFVNAVSVITLLVLLPMIGVTLWDYVRGSSNAAEFMQNWKEIALFLIGFWVRGATAESR